MKKIHITILALACAASSIQAQVTYPFQDARLSFEQRADDLCKRLTLEEKAGLMQNNSKPVPRLGIKQFQWWGEALHGSARTGLATVFPQTIGMAASFDDELLLQVFNIASTEARAKYNVAAKKGYFDTSWSVSLWTPNVNIFRDPRWGRGQETYGEDPYLTSRMGCAVVEGLQGGKGHTNITRLLPVPSILPCIVGLNGTATQSALTMFRLVTFMKHTFQPLNIWCKWAV